MTFVQIYGNNTSIECQLFTQISISFGDALDLVVGDSPGVPAIVYHQNYSIQIWEQHIQEVPRSGRTCLLHELLNDYIYYNLFIAIPYTSIRLREYWYQNVSQTDTRYDKHLDHRIIN